MFGMATDWSSSQADRRSGMPDRLLVRVARAIHDSDPQRKFDWERLDSAALSERLRQARGAVAAMRRPTDAMLLKAIKLDPACKIEHQWPAMIDVALAEE